MPLGVPFSLLVFIVLFSIGARSEDDVGQSSKIVGPGDEGGGDDVNRKIREAQSAGPDKVGGDLIRNRIVRTLANIGDRNVKQSTLKRLVRGLTEATSEHNFAERLKIVKREVASIDGPDNDAEEAFRAAAQDSGTLLKLFIALAGGFPTDGSARLPSPGEFPPGDRTAIDTGGLPSEQEFLAAIKEALTELDMDNLGTDEVVRLPSAQETIAAVREALKRAPTDSDNFARLPSAQEDIAAIKEASKPSPAGSGIDEVAGLPDAQEPILGIQEPIIAPAAEDGVGVDPIRSKATATEEATADMIQLFELMIKFELLEELEVMEIIKAAAELQLVESIGSIHNI